MKKNLEKLLVAILAFFMPVIPALAKGGSVNYGNDLLDQTRQGLSGMLDNITKVSMVLLGIGGIVILVVVVYDVIKGERDAASKLGKWLIGIAIGFLLMYALQQVIQNMG